MAKECYFPVHPCLHLGRWLTQNVGKQSAPLTNRFLQDKRRILTYSGSGALSSAAKGLKQIGCDRLLAPSYNCGHEIEPFLRKEFQVDFYRVDKKANIDLDHFASKLQPNRQVALITHYFGFPAKIEIISDLCRSKGIYLLEDCAHSFVSSKDNRILGSWGDLAIYSFWKMLPIPDGGCLVINNPDIPGISPAIKPGSVPVLMKTIKLLVDASFYYAAMRSKVWYNILTKFKDLLQWTKAVLSDNFASEFFTIDEESFGYDSQVLDWKMSAGSTHLFKLDSPEKLKGKRRHNYLYVESALSTMKQLRPLFDYLPQGTCPLKFPLVVPEDYQDAQQRMELYDPAISRWWSHFHSAVPWDRFYESMWLKDNCFVLEIHQDMEREHLDYLIDVVLEVDKKMNKSLSAKHKRALAHIPVSEPELFAKKEFTLGLKSD
jgi:perosamine synthetase